MKEKQSIKRYVIRDEHGNIIDTNGLSVVGNVEVHVAQEGLVGQPWAESAYQDGQLDIILHGIKGEGVVDIQTIPNYEEGQEDGGENIVSIFTDGREEPYTFPIRNGRRGNGITEIQVDDHSQEGDQAESSMTIRTTDGQNATLRVRNGKRGNGIDHITEQLSQSDGGTNTHVIHDTDGNQHVIHTSNGKTGPQGETGIYDRNDPDTPVFTLATTTGMSQTKVMTQKAVTDALIGTNIAGWDSVENTRIPLLAVDGDTLVSANSGKDTHYIRASEKTIYKIVVTKANTGTKTIGLCDDTPAAGVSVSEVLTTLTGKNFTTYVSVPRDAYLFVAITRDADFSISIYRGVSLVEDVGRSKFVAAVSQVLSDSEKLQARMNIGAASDSMVEEALLKYEDVTLPESGTTIIKGDGSVGTTSGNTACLVPVQEGEKYEIQTSSLAGFYAVLTGELVAGSPAPFASGYTGRVTVNTGAKKRITVPPGGSYLYLHTSISAGATGIKARKASIGRSVWTEDVKSGIAADGLALGSAQIQSGVVNSKSSSGYRIYFAEARKDDKVTVRCSDLGNYSMYLWTGSTRPQVGATGYSYIGAVGEAEYEYTMPSDGYFCVGLTQGQTEVTLGITRPLDAAIEYLESQILEAKDGLVYPDEVDFGSLSFKGYMINSADKWTSGSDGQGGKFVPVLPDSLYRVTYSGNYIIYAVLTSAATSGSALYADGCSKITSLVNASPVEIRTPHNAKYLFIKYVQSSGNPATVSRIERITSVAAMTEMNAEAAEDAIRMRRKLAEALANKLTPLNVPTDENGYEIPQTLQELYVQKKGYQLLNIRWTPKAEIGSRVAASPFQQGTTYTGLPYSSVKERGKYVGIDVSLHTFMTAVNNPYSLLYTEDVCETTQRSAWGFQYHGVNCRPYYGVVCSAYALQAVGMVVQWTSYEDEWCARKNLNMIKIHDQSAQGLRIGDIYHKKGHNRLILGLKRSADGIVTHVLMSESTSPLVKSTLYMAADFNSKLASEVEGVIYRSTELYKNTYEPSAYVPVMGETAEEVTYNNDICTYAGDRASFHVGELVVLNYDLDGQHGGWTEILVYKGGTLVGTYPLAGIDQSELPEAQQGHALSLGTSLTQGVYKACMSDGNGNTSGFTEWEVLKTDFSLEKLGDDRYKLTWDSAGTPEEYDFGDLKRYLSAHGEITSDDLERGYVILRPAALYKEMRGGSMPASHDILKVHFRGLYGRVVNEPVYVNFDTGETSDTPYADTSGEDDENDYEETT